MDETDAGPDSASWSEVVVEVGLTPGGESPVFAPLDEPATCPSWCMSAQRVRLLRRYVSRDGLRQIYVFSAPDADAVRQVVEALFEGTTAHLSTWPTRR